MGRDARKCQGEGRTPHVQKRPAGRPQPQALLLRRLRRIGSRLGRIGRCCCVVSRLFPGDVRDFDRRVESEVEARLRRDFHLLAFGQRLNCDAATGTNPGSDRCAFPTASESPDESAKGRATADDRGRTFSTGATFFLKVSGRECVRFALIGDGVESHGEFTGALELSGRTGLHNFEQRVQTFRRTTRSSTTTALSRDPLKFWPVEAVVESIESIVRTVTTVPLGLAQREQAQELAVPKLPPSKNHRNSVELEIEKGHCGKQRIGIL